MIVNRDMEYTKRMVGLKKSTGYPQRFRAAWAKNSNEKVWEAANILHEADMLKAVTLAMQSMDDQVLLNIQRKNISFDKFGELVQRYEQKGIATYTELILGLSGESLKMYIDGIDKNLEAGQFNLSMYMNMMLPNTEQAHPDYIKRFGIKTCDMKAMLIHGTPEPDVVRERQETIIETAAMPLADWKKGWLYSRVIECFHCLGLLQHVARTYHEVYGLHYRDFYINFIDWADQHPETVVGRELAKLRTLRDGALQGGSWDCVDPLFGNISWPPEELVYLHICLEKVRFYDEIFPFIMEVVEDKTTQSAIQETTLQEQREMIVVPEKGKEAEWARDAVWFARKGSSKLRIKKAGNPVTIIPIGVGSVNSGCE